jgi:hypothetical protein
MKHDLTIFAKRKSCFRPDIKPEEKEEEETIITLEGKKSAIEVKKEANEKAKAMRKPRRKKDE